MNRECQLGTLQERTLKNVFKKECTGPESRFETVESSEALNDRVRFYMLQIRKIKTLKQLKKRTQKNSKEQFNKFRRSEKNLQHIGHISHAAAPDHHDHNDTIAD